jgi:UDP-N-acetyl-D-mannosaminuronic acid dehydrogenase
MKTISVIGGCGHVGLPLSAVLSNSGFKVFAYDINLKSVNLINQKKAPFWEPGLDELISSNSGKNLIATDNPHVIAESEIVILIVGTPLDVHLNPDPNAVITAVKDVVPFLRNGQLLILRSTVFPGVTAKVERLIDSLGLKLEIAFCPERIAEGLAIKELHELPQLIGVRSDKTAANASVIFQKLGVKTVKITPEEAEFAKLFTNTWRYIKFAAANQFWMMANDSEVSYENIRDAIRFEYPRANDLPGAGFAAGPCLFKDTMQLSTFSGNNFPLGQAAMMINEGQPNYIVEKLREKFDLPNLNVGILGMAFKGESDDNRSSLSYKLKRILKFYCKEVLTTDPYVKTDSNLLPLEKVVSACDILIIGSPHNEYRELKTEKIIIDIWNLRKSGSSV